MHTFAYHCTNISSAHFWNLAVCGQRIFDDPISTMHARSLNSVAITPNLLTWLPSERKQNVMFSRVKWPTLAPRVSLCPHIKALHSYISLQSFEHKSLYPLIFWYRHLAYLSFSDAESVLQNGIIDVCWTKVSQIKLNYWDDQSHTFCSSLQEEIMSVCLSVCLSVRNHFFLLQIFNNLMIYTMQTIHFLKARHAGNRYRPVLT